MLILTLSEGCDKPHTIFANNHKLLFEKW